MTLPKPLPLFDGATYDHKRDYVRLSGQIKRVYDVMRDGRWRTLNEISNLTGDPHASISTRLRDFRKEKFGGHTVNRRYIDNGLYEYQLDVVHEHND